MGGQNVTQAQREQQNVDRQKAEASKSQPIQSGGSGQGVIITNPSATTQGLKEQTYGGKTSPSESQSLAQKQTEYAKSLVQNAGLAPGSPQYWNAVREYQKANRLTTSSQEDQALLESYLAAPHTKREPEIIQPKSFDTNYGYSGNAKLSPIIKNTNLNPLDVNFDLAKTREATQARNQFKMNISPDQGGVITERSKGRNYGQAVVSAGEQRIGAKIFRNQTPLTRNSPLEEAVKSSEAKRAESIYPKTIGTKAGYEPSINVKPIESSATFKDVLSTSPKEITTSSKENIAENNLINFGNGLISLSNKQIAERNNQIELGNGLISLSNQQIEFKNQVERNQFIGNLIGRANTVGSDKINIVSPDNKILESVPISQAKQKLPSLLDKYANQKVSFSVTPKNISSPKETITPSSVLALDLNYLGSKDFTGKYFDISKAASGFYEEQKSAALLPATNATGKANIGFGLNPSLPNFLPTISEFGSNVGAVLKEGIKATPPLMAGLGQEYYNILTTGKSGSASVRTRNIQEVFGGIAHKVFYPADIMSPYAAERMSIAQQYIHTNIGKPLKSVGVPIPQSVQNPKTVGAFLGTTTGLVAPFVKSPFSREPIIVEGKVMARMPSGEGYVEVPGVIKISGTTLGTGKYAIGLGMKSSEGTKIPFVSTLRPGTPYMREILGKMEATSERGAEAGAVTNLTASKLYTEKGAKTLSDIGVVSEEHQKGLVNLGYEISKKGDLLKIPNVEIPKGAVEDYVKKMVLTGNPETNLSMITELGKGQPKTVPIAKGSFGNVLPINYFNKILGKESAGLYASYMAKSNKQFPIGFAKSETPIPVRGVETIHDIDADLKRLEQRQKAEGKENAKLDINSKEYKAIVEADISQSNKILSLLQTNVKVPKGFGFAKSGLTNIAFGKITKLGKGGIPEQVQGETVLNLLGIKEEINTEGAAGASSKYTGGRSFNVPPPEGEVNYGGLFKVKTISYQAWAKMKSVLSYQSKETFGKYKTVEPDIYAKTSFGGKRNIVAPPLIRVKDISDLYSISRYAERTTKGGTSKRFGQLAENLQKNYPQIDWSVIEENAKNTKYVFSKEAKESIQTESARLNPPSGRVTPVSQLVVVSPSRNQNTNQSVKNTLSSFSNISKFGGSTKISYRILSGSMGSSKLSKLSGKSPVSGFSPSGKSPKSPSSPYSALSPSPRSPKSPKSSYSPYSPTSPTSIYSPTSPYSPYSPTSPSSPRSPTSPSPKSPLSPFSPLSPSGRQPLTPSPTFPYFNPPPSKKIFIPRIGAYPRRPRYRPFEKPTRTFLYNVSNIFATSLSIKEPARKRYSQFL